MDQEPLIPLPVGCWSGVLPAHSHWGLTCFHQRGLLLARAVASGASAGLVGRGLAAGCEPSSYLAWSAGTCLSLDASSGWWLMQALYSWSGAELRQVQSWFD